MHGQIAEFGQADQQTCVCAFQHLDMEPTALHQCRLLQIARQGVNIPICLSAVVHAALLVDENH